MNRLLDVSSTDVAAKKIDDLIIYGDPNAWVLINEVSSQSAGFMVSTKAMEIPGSGVALLMSRTQRNDNGTWAISETSSFIDGAEIVEEGGVKKIVSVYQGNSWKCSSDCDHCEGTD